MVATTIYRFAINFYTLVVRLAFLLGNEKAGNWLRGRKETKKELKKLSLKDHYNRAWVHCASLGEYELALPIIEGLEQRGFEIVVSFFSPSGYELVKRNAKRYAACFMLLQDSPANAKFWFERIRPTLMILSKGDTWYYYLKEAQRAQVPSYLISARFTERHFSGIISAWNRMVLQLLNGIGVQDRSSLEVLNKNGLTKGVFTGDIRYDRVLANAETNYINHIISRFASGHKVLVAGSTWPEDETVLLSAWNELRAKGWKLIIAPHELSENHLLRMEADFRAKRLSTLQEESELLDVIVIDSIGILKYLYRFGNVAYIGGAFKQGLHNTLEAAAYGIPVIFGPKTERFPEAAILISGGGGYSIRDSEELKACLMDFAENDEKLKIAGKSSLKIIQDGRGAATRTLALLFDGK